MRFVNNQGDDLGLLPVSEVLGIDSLSKPITGFWEPLICVSFLPDDNVIIFCYHRLDKICYVFLYSFKDNNLLGQPLEIEVENCT